MQICVLRRDVDLRLNELNRHVHEQSNNGAGNNAHDRTDTGHHQARRIGQRHGAHHGRLFGMIRDVPRKEHDVRGGYPNTVNSTDQQAVKEMTIRPAPCN